MIHAVTGKYRRRIIQSMQTDSRSVQTISSQELVDSVRALIEDAGIRRHRQALILSGSRRWGDKTAQNLLDAIGLETIHWFSDRAPEGVSSSQGAAAFRLLGTELDALVFDAWSGFDPDAF